MGIAHCLSRTVCGAIAWRVWCVGGGVVGFVCGGIRDVILIGRGVGRAECWRQGQRRVVGGTRRVRGVWKLGQRVVAGSGALGLVLLSCAMLLEGLRAATVVHKTEVV